MMTPVQTQRGDAIAIIGLGCRFAGGVDGPQAFWNLLAGARDAIMPVPPLRWNNAHWFSADATAPGKTNQRGGGFLDAIDQFDAPFFAIAPREAEAMDPQQRLVLEVAWEALENAAIPPAALAGLAGGVYLGLYNDNYGLTGRGSGAPETIGGWSASGTHTSIAAGRIAFQLGLTGPAIALDTACSSSLTALHLAAQGLAAGDCDIALAGGVHLILSPLSLVVSTKLGATSARGRCSAFDAEADGFVHGEGCGVLVLKRLADAAADGDRVLAVLRGSAVNQDGRSAGLTAPNGLAQEAVIRAALSRAGVAPAAVDAIEAHGTGTALGDPIEMHALRAVFGGARGLPLRVGSVKTNIGHTEAAAGIAGVIKAVLMLQHQAIPPSLHFTRLNPHIDLGDAAIEVPRALVPAALTYVGVSSFGFSGTNAHVVLQAAVAPPASRADPRAAQVLPLSARDGAGLRAMAARWQAALGAPGADFAALCHTAGAGRARFAQHRLAVVAADAAEAAAALGALLPGLETAAPAGRPRVAFLVTGQGSAYAGMASALIGGAPLFRQVLARCDAVMGLGRPLAALFEDAAALARTEIAQPALYALSAGLGALWRSWGVEPVAVLGHSVGEYAAAHLAGVLELEDGARLIATRGRLMQALPAGGGMAALIGPAAVSRAVLSRHPAVELAGENSATALTVAGPSGAIAALLADPALERGGVLGQLLPLAHAFHSRLLDPMLDGLAAAAAATPHHAARLPVIGNLSGAVVRVHDGAYWRAHARGVVRFAAGLATLKSLGCTHAVELGAQAVLSGFARTEAPDLVTLPSLARGRESWRLLLGGLGRLWTDGAPVDWAAHHRPYTTPLVAAPTYPFQRQSYWLADPTLTGTPIASPASMAAPAREAPVPGAVGDRRVSDFYDELADIASGYGSSADETEGHLTFGLVQAPRPGFSWVRSLFEGHRDPQAYAYLRAAQSALKTAIFAAVDFSEVRRVFDFGCGHAADLCALASRHPHLQLDGFTISAGQVAVGRRRAAALGLDDRLRIHHCDSARDAFPGQFDVIFGIEVSGLIEDKAALFDNIRTHLLPGGALVIADFVAATDTIASPDTASFTSTAEEWATLLADRGLRLTDCVETSQEVADFLDDPGFTGEVERLVAARRMSPLTKTHLLSNDNIGRALRAGIMRYCLFTARRDHTSPRHRLLAGNLAQIAQPSRWTPGEAAGGEAWRSWFYRVTWEPAATDSLVARGQTRLAEEAAAATAIDRLARAYLRVAELADIVPAPRYARLLTHLRTLAVEAADPAHLAVPDLPEATLLQRCGPALRQVLEGLIDPLDLLFGDGGAAAEALYAASPFAQAVNGVAGAAFDAMLAGRGPARILEIGCGTGGTTATCAPRLRKGDRYCATDVSASFAQATSRRFAVEGRVLDIARSPLDQGFALGAADVVVAANVLHATPLLRETLAHVASLLSPGGQLLLIENAGPLVWGDLTFGLTPGMWAFQDLDLRPGHALVSPETWRDLLAEAGFDAMIHQPSPAATAAVSGQFVVAARRRQGARLVWNLADGPAPVAATDLVLSDLPTPDDVGAIAGSLHVMAQAAAQAATRTVPPRLWVATASARSVHAGDRVEPGQATLWGLANAIGLEHPELRLTMLDGAGAAEIAAAVVEDGPETRIAFRQGRRLYPRLVRSAPPANPLKPIRSDATYVVTGGGAGVGQAVALWLAGAGAGRVAVLGRSVRPGMSGAIHAYPCDVADEASLAALFAALRAEGPPIAGVFHAAGVLDDAVLAQQTPERLARVLRPKVLGGMLLDRLSRDLALDHFVLFSSSAALLGAAAQANHAAANAWLDALAERRRAEGLPALSINWGAWAEIGAAAAAGEGVARRGLRPMDPADALAAFSAALGAPEPVLGILDVDWARFLERFPADAVPPFLAGLRTRAAADAVARPMAGEAKPAQLRAVLEATAPADRAAALCAHVQVTAAGILGLRDGTLPPLDAPLREFGLDSLMTIELRNALAAAIGVRLPATLVFDHPTCEALAARLDGELFGEAPAPADALDALDADALAALLDEELASVGAS
jgi:acyl transferase domain-containing protein/SAM-dependent methyltransferase